MAEFKIIDTIAAIATPPGRGGVGIIRVSGPLAQNIAQSITRHLHPTPRMAHFVRFYGSDSTVIDEGLLLYFKAPHSFTGEAVVEFQVHGAPLVLDMIMQACLAQGARVARPGEFSERAFLNNKMDLTQAEAIADLINASSQTAARMAVRSLQGDFSKKINDINQQIVYLRLYVEAAIDFPEEEIDFLNDGKVVSLLNELRASLEIIKASAHQGAIVREGLSVVIAGRPNAGKSTLINALSGREVAIVTDVAGTTRDVMREHVLLDDIPLHLIDTAGLRESNDLVEKEGIKRAWDEVRRADCVLLVVDASMGAHMDSLSDEIKAELPKDVPVVLVFNKIDRLTTRTNVDPSRIYLSAKTGEGLSSLKQTIKTVVGYQPAEGQFLARRRHLQALDKALALLSTGHEQLMLHRAGELLAEDLRLAHLALCEITGEFSSDDLLGEIFSSFCIGK